MKRKEVIAGFLQRSEMARAFAARSRLYDKVEKTYYTAFENAVFGLEHPSDDDIRKAAEDLRGKMRAEFGACSNLGLTAFGFYGSSVDILLPIKYSNAYTGLHKILVDHCVEAMQPLGDVNVRDYVGLVDVTAKSGESRLGYAIKALSAAPNDFETAKVRFCLSFSFGNDEVEYDFSRSKIHAARKPVKYRPAASNEVGEPEEEVESMIGGAAYKTVIAHLQKEELASAKELIKLGATQFRIDTMESIGYISTCGVGFYEATEKGIDAYGLKDLA